MIGWQNIVVILILALAGSYLCRRAWLCFRSFATRAKFGAASCGETCAGCALAKPQEQPRILPGCERPAT